MRRLIALLAVVLAGCATHGTNSLQYKQPGHAAIVNEAIVPAPFERVWDVLVRELAKAFYVINTIDKQSRLINVTFNASEPGQFVDCGRSERKFSDGEIAQAFEYDLASHSTFRVASPPHEQPMFTSRWAQITREPTLEGRANIYIEPLEADPPRTAVIVNARYLLTVKVRGERFSRNVLGTVHSRGALPEDSTSFSFHTKTVAVKDETNPVLPPVMCVPKGRLEADVLAIVKNVRAPVATPLPVATPTTAPTAE
jgi:hypothetical protein